jgi:hypothetical protein
LKIDTRTSQLALVSASAAEGEAAGLETAGRGSIAQRSFRPCGAGIMLDADEGDRGRRSAVRPLQGFRLPEGCRAGYRAGGNTRRAAHKHFLCPAIRQPGAAGAILFSPTR